MTKDEFLSRLPTLYAVDAERGCWIWQMQVADTGYGKVHFEGRKRQAHRVVYETMVGPVPEGLDLDHLCRVRHCVNPAHLEPVSRSVNLLRGKGVSEYFARQTHCKNGHPLSGDNLRLTSKGYRVCVECSRVNLRRSRLSARGGIPAAPLNKDKTHCNQGHPLSGENLRIDPRGSRICVECKRESVRRSRARKREKT